MVDNSDPGLEEIYTAVMNDSDNTNWAVIGYNDDYNALEVKSSGEGNWDEFLDFMCEEGVIHYGYCRVNTGDEESKRAKFVLTAWIGRGTSVLKKAKVSVHKASVKEVFRNFAVEVAGESRDDFRESEIMAQVVKAMGANYSGNT